MAYNSNQLTDLPIMLIGPLPIEGDQIGGAKISFLQMANDFEMIAPNSFVINTSRRLANKGKLARLFTNAIGALNSTTQIFFKGFHSKVWVLNISANAGFGWGPLIYGLARIQRKPIVFRFFGGDLHDKYLAKSAISKWIFRNTVGKSQVLLLQTHQLMSSFHFTRNPKRFPTTRNMSSAAVVRKQCRRFIFLAQIRAEKGVETILDAMDQIDRPVEVHFYGTSSQPELIDRINAHPQATYGGQLSKREIESSLQESDVLLLPTKWTGEGLPGVIIEAFQCGLPVITTRWMQIPELIANNEDGILIEPDSTTELVSAMRSLIDDDHRCSSMSAAAIAKGQQYNSLVWNQKLATWCMEIADGNATPTSATKEGSQKF